MTNKYKIVKTEYGSGKVHFKIQFSKWHLVRCIRRHLCGVDNSLFQIDDFETFQYALNRIKDAETQEKALKKVSKTVIPVWRTEVPNHIPEEQREDYISHKNVAR